MTADPEELRALAQAVAVRGEAVASVGGNLASRLVQTTWRGTGASRFRYEWDQLDRRLALDVDTLRRISMALRRLADALEEELRELRLIEDRVRAWLVMNPTLPRPWPAHALPPTGAPQWREVQQAFVTAGVALDAPLVPAGPRPSAGDWKATLSPAEAWIIEAESSFDPEAVNTGSGAFGLWQGLGATLDTYAARFGFDRHTTDPWQQLTMFRAYVADRYGNAEAAVAFHKENDWY